MRKLALNAILVALLAASVPAISSAARPAYCSEALRRCFDDCRTSYVLFNYGCAMGCEIGYLFCGR